ncbi:metalloregulator ArsR/SmtB family transcription factor [soil metagenome]
MTLRAGIDSEDRATSIFAALGDPVRRGIVEALSEVPYLTLTSIANRFPLSRQAVTKHVAVLERAGMVTITSVGRERHVALVPESLRAAKLWLEEIGKEWDARLAAPKKYLAESPGTG